MQAALAPAAARRGDRLALVPLVAMTGRKRPGVAGRRRRSFERWGRSILGSKDVRFGDGLGSPSSNRAYRDHDVQSRQRSVRTGSGSKVMQDCPDEARVNGARTFDALVAELAASALDLAGCGSGLRAGWSTSEVVDATLGTDATVPPQSVQHQRPARSACRRSTGELREAIVATTVRVPDRAGATSPKLGPDSSASAAKAMARADGRASSDPWHRASPSLG
jgi:hypothetical protein